MTNRQKQARMAKINKGLEGMFWVLAVAGLVTMMGLGQMVWMQ